MTGTPPGTFLYGPIRRNVKANVSVRIKIPLTRRARRAVKRGARRGKKTRASIVTIGRDSACFRNRAHSTRLFELTP